MSASARLALLGLTAGCQHAALWSSRRAPHPRVARCATPRDGSLPGDEFDGRMAIVILGGLVTSTALNLLLLPVLCLRFGRFEPVAGLDVR